jgi:putative hemolysin
MSQSYNPFVLPLKPQWLAAAIERLLSLSTLAKYYDQRPNADAEHPNVHVDEFLDHTLTSLKSNFSLVNPEALAAIPKSGPTLFIANHPLGGLEGVAMTQQLRAIRPDLKVLTNELLSLIPEFSDVFIGVDVLSQDAAVKNMRGMRKVLKHMRKGGALLIYPAGKVSAINTKNWRIEDSAWSDVVGKLAQQYQATCVPFYVHGRNSRLFYASGLIHPRLRTALLPREMLNAHKRQSTVTVGTPINWNDMKALGNVNELTLFLRTATEFIANPSISPLDASHAYPPLEIPPRDKATMATLQEKLFELEEYRLLQHGSFDVYCAPFDQLGIVMDEIAVAREKTFRAAGEGTGTTYDSDKYDPHYLHLFIWDTEKNAMVGGYRIGETNKIIEALGVDGLYSRSLYEFNADYIQRVGHALEVGRSYVSVEYQRHPRALDLLWQGIGRWVAKNPYYHTLFGCVSISKQHSAHAREFLSDAMMQNFSAEPKYLKHVKPVNPLKAEHRNWSSELLKSLSTIALINKLLGQSDPGKSIPVLLRQYLALNGRFIGFSVNHGFNDSLDGLIMVDLRQTPNKYLQRYLGKDGCNEFTAQWSTNHAAA